MKYILLNILLINIAIAHPIDNLEENIKSFGTIEIYGQINIDINYICNPIIQSCDNIPKKLLSVNSLNALLKETPILKSSSVCIKNSDTSSTFITANHVCTEIVDSTSVSGTFKNNLNIIFNNLLKLNSLISPKEIDVKFYSHVKNIDNKKYKIKKVLKSIEESDLCLIEVEGNYKNTSNIAKRKPKIGDVIYNIAVPQGIQFKNSLPIFTGIFSGKYQTENQEESYLLSIPASQGSSGSPVFNQEGEIIGIIYAAFKSFSHLSISSTLDQVNILLR